MKQDASCQDVPEAFASNPGSLPVSLAQLLQAAGPLHRPPRWAFGRRHLFSLAFALHDHQHPGPSGTPGQVGFALEVAFVGVSFSRALIWELPEGVRVGPGNTSRPPPRVDFDGKTLSRGGCQPLLCPLQWNPLSEGPCPADGPPPHLISSTKSTSRSECVSFLEARDL